jgi:hypothetical protein
MELGKDVQNFAYAHDARMCYYILYQLGSRFLYIVCPLPAILPTIEALLSAYSVFGGHYLLFYYLAWSVVQQSVPLISLHAVTPRVSSVDYKRRMSN